MKHFHARCDNFGDGLRIYRICKTGLKSSTVGFEILKFKVHFATSSTKLFLGRRLITVRERAVELADRTVFLGSTGSSREKKNLLLMIEFEEENGKWMTKKKNDAARTLFSSFFGEYSKELEREDLRRENGASVRRFMPLEPFDQCSTMFGVSTRSNSRTWRPEGQNAN